MSLFLEALVIATPIAFQIVLDEVIVLNDQDLLVIVALGLGLILAFRAVVDFVRSWSIMAAGATLTLQWKMTLFRHLIHLPLSFFERRHVGDLASRFGSLDVIQKTLSTEAISAIVDGLMSVALFGMMWLYQPLLAALAVGVMVLYGILRAVAYHLYRHANEQSIVYGARENTHFLETLRGMPSIKALVIGDRRQSTWNNYLADQVGADLHVQRLDLVFRTANTVLFGLDRIAIVYLGATAVLSGSLTVGMLVAFLAYKDQFSTRIATLLDTAVKAKLLELHSERVADIALADPEEEALAYTPYLPGRGWAGAADRAAERAGHQLPLRRQRAAGDQRLLHRDRRRRMRRDRWSIGCRQDDAAEDISRACCARAKARCCSKAFRSRRWEWSSIARRSAASCRTTGCSPGSIADNIAAFDPSPDPTASSTRRNLPPSIRRSCGCRWATRRWSATWAARSRADSCNASC